MQRVGTFCIVMRCRCLLQQARILCSCLHHGTLRVQIFGVVTRMEFTRNLTGFSNITEVLSQTETSWVWPTSSSATVNSTLGDQEVLSNAPKTIKIFALLLKSLLTIWTSDCLTKQIPNQLQMRENSKLNGSQDLLISTRELISNSRLCSRVS